MIKIYMSRLKSFETRDLSGHAHFVFHRGLYCYGPSVSRSIAYDPFLTVTWKSGCPWNRKKIAFIDFQVTWSKVTLLVLYLGAVFSIPNEHFV